MVEMILSEEKIDQDLRSKKRKALITFAIKAFLFVPRTGPACRQAGSNQHVLSNTTTSKWLVYQPACRQAGFNTRSNCKY